MTQKQVFALIVTAVILVFFAVLKIIRISNPLPVVDNSQTNTVSEPVTNTVLTEPAQVEPSTLTESQFRTLEDYLKVNISLLSPKREVLGGKFYLTKLDLIDNQNALISYEDGHISLDARIKFYFLNNLPALTEFTLIGENGQPYQTSSSTSASSSTEF